jgi:plasmid stabilization system protein ParE
MTYAFHPDARREFREATAFYESRRPSLGATFSREVEATVERIVEAPEQFGFIEHDVRRCLTRTFPYAILYTVEFDLILIVAVVHRSRKPGYWRERLDP